MFGDALSAEWQTLLYMPLLTPDQGPRLHRVGRRVVEDALAENHYQVGVESEREARAHEIERTRGWK